MGCGESKHEVASGNTVRNSSKRMNSKKGKDYETLPSEQPDTETKNGNGVPDGGKVKGNENPKAETAAANTQGTENGKLNTSTVEEKVKEKKNEILKAKEEEKLNEKLKQVKVDEKLKELEAEKKEDEKLKGETSIEGIISEGISGKSEYFSPRASKDGDSVVEEEGKGKDEEKKIETKTVEAGKVKEETPVKEEKVSTTTVEEKVSTSNGEIKVSSPKEEAMTETPAKEVVVTEFPAKETIVIETPATEAVVIESPAKAVVIETPAT